MIKASHNPLLYKFFKIYSTIKIKNNFNKVHICGDVDVLNQSVLLIANHISWWDGFWTLHLCINKLNKKFYFMMHENELKKRWIFSHSGGFSVTKGSKSIVETINYSVDLLNDSNNLVLMFPQGKLNSLYNDEFIFQSGVERIVEKAQNTKVIFQVSMIDYFDHPKPELFLYLKEYKPADGMRESIQQSFSEFYKTCARHQKRKEK